MAIARKMSEYFVHLQDVPEAVVLVVEEMLPTVDVFNVSDEFATADAASVVVDDVF